jgi:hypothetical protein
MTIPEERIYSIKRTREFLRSLLDPKLTPRVPRSVRKDAYWCLRHYPADYDLPDIMPKVFKEEKEYNKMIRGK